MTTTYVVTGGAGFIGSHIAERLLREGHKVRIVDNFITGKRDNLAALKGDIEFHEVSITDVDALRPIFKGVDTIFHHAALASVPLSIEKPLLTHEHNATGTLTVLTAAKDVGVRRVVYAASSSAYGNDASEQQTETTPPKPISPYGVSKLVGEYYCQSFAHVYNLETVCLRYFNVFGTRQDPTSQYAAVIPLFVTSMIDGKAPTIYGDGLQSRDFCFVENVVHGNLLAAQAEHANGQVINIATGMRVNLLELVAQINAHLGTNLRPIHAEGRTGDVKHSRADVSKAKTLLGYEPVIAFEDGLKQTIEWYQGRS
ncbi:MAG: SDR family oxidoreductase [Chloroflexi bacterium]|nr:SDR family oxidoreductase [Chloroflexota bacterium]MCC6894976.1 SDR family oxidoreductase [Anaerolineae bacterium]